MKKVIYVFLGFTFFLLAFFTIWICVSEKEPEKLPIPDISTFNDTEIEQHDNRLPELDKAILYTSGKKQEISKNDRRLIRLLNFCTYAEDNGMSMWSVMVEYSDDKGDIENGDRLEIFFKNVRSTEIGQDFIMYDKFVIKENSVWLIQSDPLYEMFHDDETLGASVWYPYAGRCEGVENLNFLVEAGFI